MDAIVRFLETGRPAEYAYPSVAQETSIKGNPMERAEVQQLVITMINSGTDDWDEAIKNLKRTDRSAIQEMESVASGMAVQAAMLSEYLEYRGAAGMGDHGHEDALRQAQRARKRIRMAIGYSYP
jgi:hypothetical protein